MGYYKDLREFLEVLEKHGKLARVKRPVSKETELMPFFRLQFRGLPEEERRVFLFENVLDCKGKKQLGMVAPGVYGASRSVYALGMMVEPEEINERWRQALANPIPPLLVGSGPVHEEVHMGEELQELGLDEIPAPVEEPGFSGTIRTGTQIVTRDPETGVRNVGEYGGHFRGRDRLLWGIGPTHHGFLQWRKAHARGIPLQGAIIVGATPNLAQAASAPIPVGVDEYAVAGGIAGEPMSLVRCKTVDIEVPATAEFVIEVEISTERMEPHAAFGEYPGYMYQGHGDAMPAMRVTCITHRKNPIFTPFLVGLPPSDCHTLLQISTEYNYWEFLKYHCNIPEVLDVAFPDSGGGWNYCVVQIKKKHSSQPWQVLQAASGFDALVGKIIIVVDEDVDPRDPDSVNWALSFAMQPHRDVRIVTGKTPGLDPSAHPPHSSLQERSFPSPAGSSALLIDATRKWSYPPVGLPKKEYMDAALKIWEEEGFPKLRLRKPWYGYSLGNWTADDEENARLILEGKYVQIGQKLSEKAVNVKGDALKV
jgi:4-hydroxy-3-polyprenylbenzoate decarboxylase